MAFVVHPGASYGWKMRFGLLQPTLVSDNNPFEFYLMAPDGVQLVLTSLGIWDGPREEQYRRAIEGIENPIRRLLSRGVDVIIQAGVPPIVSRGWGFEEELKARVAGWTDVPFATDIGCCISALEALEARRVAVLASETLQRGLSDYMHSAGVEVISSRSLELAQEAEVHNLPLSLAFRAAVELHRSAPEAQALLILGAFMPTVGMIGELEATIGIPVVSSAQAMMWRGLKLAGHTTSNVTGFGRLLLR